MIDFILDFETLSLKTNAVVLSCGIVAVDLSKDFTEKDLRYRSLFVKFDSKNQTNRHISLETLNWWRSQSPEVQRSQLLPSASDVSLVDGYRAIQQFIKLNCMTPNKAVYWCRGDLEATVSINISEELGLEPLCPYYRWREVRTAVDLLSGSDNGYCDTIPAIPDNLIEHDPVDDCIRDLWMLRYYP